jgi:hypothetical protein
MVQFATLSAKDLTVETLMHLKIQWPARLASGASLALHIYGRVADSERETVTVELQRYYFATTTD